MEVPVEVHRTSTNFCTMVCNRLEVISHEDIDTIASLWIVPFVATAVAHAKVWYHPARLGRSRMPIGNALRLMCRAPKSGEGDHFHAAIGGRSEVERFVPSIPDWTQDPHTITGKRLGRGLDYFREISTVLVPAPTRQDDYEEDAYRMWRLREAGGARAKRTQGALFSADAPEN